MYNLIAIERFEQELLVKLEKIIEKVLQNCKIISIFEKVVIKWTCFEWNLFHFYIKKHLIFKCCQSGSGSRDREYEEFSCFSCSFSGYYW